METDLDRYYTPVALAQEILQHEFPGNVKSAVDSTCGIGNLLSAASNLYDDVKCIGIDRDKYAIEILKKKNPKWLLSVGEILKNNSFSKTAVASSSSNCELLLLNPPYSLGNKKYIEVVYEGNAIRASVAMANILKSIDIFRPKNGAMVVAPESILYSDIDLNARTVLFQKYFVEIISELRDLTFSGARVRTAALKLQPGKRKVCILKPEVKDYKVEYLAKIVRGTMPVFKVKNSKSKKAVPFLHSTDFKKIKENKRYIPSTKIQCNEPRMVLGHLVLLPRVGRPYLENIVACYFKDKIILSDCVIALQFDTRNDAKLAEVRIKENFENLLNNYRGTGARYITVSRLQHWLQTHGFNLSS